MSKTHFSARFDGPETVSADWLIVGVWEDEPFDESLRLLDEKLGGVLGRLRERGDLTGKTNELVPVLDLKGLEARRLLVVGFGKKKSLDRCRLNDAGAVASRMITGKKLARLAMVLPAKIEGFSSGDIAYLLGCGLMQGAHGPGIRKSDPDRFAPEEISIVTHISADRQEVEDGVRRAGVEGRAVWLARELVNMPPCDLYPESFADRAREAANEVGIECSILDENQLLQERMGAMLGVGRGSDRPPRLVVLRYRGGHTDKTLAWVGKGVTFDSGGLSLKTTDQMVDMKCDMAGAATVLAGILAAAALEVPVNLLGVLPLVENLPGGRAFKLGDVLQTRSGKTIEILNTDAEGRLILADALTYAVDQKVNHLVDLATLTGACVVALGVDVAGLMANDKSWAEQVLQAAGQAGERAWQLPMYSFYDDMIKSHVADFRNTGGTRYGGAITAAKLLEQFVGKTPWAHLDIAGPAWSENESPARDAGGTGAFVRTLVELARRYESLHDCADKK